VYQKWINFLLVIASNLSGIVNNYIKLGVQTAGRCPDVGDFHPLLVLYRSGFPDKMDYQHHTIG
jgi:hypothetical protein